MSDYEYSGYEDEEDINTSVSEDILNEYNINGKGLRLIYDENIKRYGLLITLHYTYYDKKNNRQKLNGLYKLKISKVFNNLYSSFNTLNANVAESFDLTQYDKCLEYEGKIEFPCNVKILNIIPLYFIECDNVGSIHNIYKYLDIKKIKSNNRIDSSKYGDASFDNFNKIYHYIKKINENKYNIKNIYKSEFTIDKENYLCFKNKKVKDLTISDALITSKDNKSFNKAHDDEEYIPEEQDLEKEETETEISDNEEFKNKILNNDIVVIEDSGDDILPNPKRRRIIISDDEYE